MLVYIGNMKRLVIVQRKQSHVFPKSEFLFWTSSLSCTVWSYYGYHVLGWMGVFLTFCWPIKTNRRWQKAITADHISNVRNFIQYVHINVTLLTKHSYTVIKNVSHYKFCGPIPTFYYTCCCEKKNERLVFHMGW